MTRPTREQVDESLRMTDHIEGAYADTPTEQEILLDSLCRDQVILAREVRALREERDWCGTNHGNNMCPVGLQKVRELQAEAERLQRAAVPGNGPEMLRMQVELKRLREEMDVQCKWRDGYLAKAKELEAENARLKSDLIELNKANTRLLRQRNEVLGLKTTEGLSAAEWMLRTSEAETKLRRVEALPKAWRETAALAHNHWDRAKTYHEEGMQAGTNWCADELDAALKGPA